MTADAIDHSSPGPFTRLDTGQFRLLDGLPDDPVEVCAVVRTLVIQPSDAARLGLPEERIAEKDIRPAGGLLAARQVGRRGHGEAVGPVDVGLTAPDHPCSEGQRPPPHDLQP